LNNQKTISKEKILIRSIGHVVSCDCMRTGRILNKNAWVSSVHSVYLH